MGSSLPTSSMESNESSEEPSSVMNIPDIMSCAPATVASFATVAQPAVEEKSVPAKSKLVVPALALAAAAVAMAPAAPASAAAAAAVATINQADTAWILISTGT